MDDIKILIAKLEDNPKTLYSSVEMNEILFRMYSRVILALLLRAEIIAVAPLQVRYLNSSREEIQIPHNEVSKVQHISYIEILNLMFLKDKLIADVLIEVARNGDEVWFRIRAPMS